MNIVAIVQARMGSNRLPGKVLKKISGKPMLWHVIERVKRCKGINSIIVATTNNKKDSRIASLATKCRVNIFRGSEDDVLSRFYWAAKQYTADIIVRVTADSPLIDPHRIDEAINLLIDDNCDYINPDRNFSLLPRGIRAEVFPFKALERAHQEALSRSDREHVTSFIQREKALFKYGWLKGRNEFQIPSLRFVVDEDADLHFIRKIYSKLYKYPEIISLDDVFRLLETQKNLLEINKHVTQKNH